MLSRVSTSTRIEYPSKLVRFKSICSVVAIWFLIHVSWKTLFTLPRLFVGDHVGGFRRSCDLNVGSKIFPPYASLRSIGIVTRTDGAKLAIAIPAIPQQLSRVADLLRSWVDIKPALNTIKVDVFLFRSISTSNTLLNDDLAQLDELRELAKVPFLALGNCMSFQVVDMHLTAEQDVYPLGPAVMFLNIQKLMFDKGYEVFILMEPDVRPLRQGWADAILKTVNLDEKWWVRGSAWMSEDLSFMRRNSKWVWSSRLSHLNGNAIYRADDLQFLQFTWLALALPRPPWPISIFKRKIDGFDHTMRNALESLRNCPKHRWLLSRFVYSSIMINFSQGPCLSDPELSAEFPDAYLAHFNTAKCQSWRTWRRK